MAFKWQIGSPKKGSKSAKKTKQDPPAAKDHEKRDAKGNQDEEAPKIDPHSHASVKKDDE